MLRFEIVYPKEGESKIEGDKTFIWTKRVLDSHSTVYEWVEESKPTLYDYTPHDDIYF